MIQIEFINEDLCATCGDCCKIYKELRESGFVTKKEGDFFINAFEQFGVYPKRNPFIHFDEYCEFHDTSTGCIISRENRPLDCRLYACDKLYQNCQLNKIYFSEFKRGMRPTQFLIDENSCSLIPTFEDVDIDEIKQTAINRINICLSCSELTERNGKKACKQCGCGLFNKVYRKYPLDENGKAISQLAPDRSYRYSCPLKKW